MKTVATLFSQMIIWFMAAAAFAATGGRQDNSSLVVWIFLGFCALIVVAQLFPSIRDIRVAARKEKQETEQENAEKAPARAGE